MERSMYSQFPVPYRAVLRKKTNTCEVHNTTVTQKYKRPLTSGPGLPWNMAVAPPHLSGCPELVLCAGPTSPAPVFLGVPVHTTHVPPSPRRSEMMSKTRPWRLMGGTGS